MAAIKWMAALCIALLLVGLTLLSRVPTTEYRSYSSIGAMHVVNTAIYYKQETGSESKLNVTTTEFWWQSAAVTDSYLSISSTAGDIEASSTAGSINGSNTAVTDKAEPGQPAEYTGPPIPAGMYKPDGTILSRRTKPHNHVTFLKTHKCASSTIQNILMRYGLKNHLTFSLPPGGGNHIGWPRAFQPNMLRKSKPPDIHCYHSTFSPSLLTTMPADAINIAAVRDPLTQIRSEYIYYGFHSCSKNSLVDLILSERKQDTVCGLPFNNPVMLDMGMTYVAMGNHDEVEAYVKMLDSKFHLVIVVEYFYESIIVMRDMLGWSNLDVATFALNYRKEGSTSSAAFGADLPDTDEFKEKLYSFLYADKQLYDHFRKKMEQIITANKDYIQQEVKALKQYQDDLMGFCIMKSVPKIQIKDSRFKPYGNGAYGYLLTENGLKNQTCIDMASAELTLVGKINRYQPPLR